MTKYSRVTLLLGHDLKDPKNPTATRSVYSAAEGYTIEKDGDLVLVTADSVTNEAPLSGVKYLEGRVKLAAKKAEK